MQFAGIGVSCCVGFGLLLTSTLVLAESNVSRSTSSAGSARVSNAESLDNLFYQFDDDALNALGNDAQGMVLRVRPGAARVLLLRPRVQFVTEMLQSVEAL
jgi:hypothetical protein